MDVLHPRGCGLDVHKATVVACVCRVVDGKTVKETRTFATTTASLIALSEWLTETQMYARRNGSDGCLLEACLAHIVRRRLRAGAGECRPYQERARRRQRCRLDL